MLARLRWFALLAVAPVGMSLGARAQDPFAETEAAAAEAARAEASPSAAATAAVTVTVDVGTQSTSDDPVAQLSARLQEAELKIRRELVKSTTLDFVETPLAEVVMFLQDLHQIPVKLDATALENAGVADDTPITNTLREVSLHTALRQVLEPLDLTYLVAGEVLMITTRDEAQAHPEVRVYNVDGLASEKSIDDLIKVITSTCTPESWKTTGGFGQIEEFQGKLVVRQSGEVQWEISQLLADLRR